MDIKLAVPPAIHVKLKEVAGHRSVEAWAQQVLTRAAEEAQPSLTQSALWRRDVREWRVLAVSEED